MDIDAARRPAFGRSDCKSAGAHLRSHPAGSGPRVSRRSHLAQQEVCTSASLLRWSWPKDNRPRTPRLWSSPIYALCLHSRACAGLELTPVARLDCSDNLVAHCGGIRRRRAHSPAPPTVVGHFRIHKGGGQPIEARSPTLRCDRRAAAVWDSTQMPHKTAGLVEALGLPKAIGDRARRRRRLDQNPFYPEELAIRRPRSCGRPGRVEDRRECFTATNHEREQDWEMKRRSRGQAARDPRHLRHDHCATTPSDFAAAKFGHQLIGPYVLPAYRLEAPSALPSGGGDSTRRRRTQGTFVMERLLDRIADELGLGHDEFAVAISLRRSRCLSRCGHDPRRPPPTTYTAARIECRGAARWQRPVGRTSRPAARRARRPPARHRPGNYVEERGAAVRKRAVRTIGKDPSRPARLRRDKEHEPCWRSLPPGARCQAAQIHVTDGDTRASPRLAPMPAGRRTAGNAVHLAA